MVETCRHKRVRSDVSILEPTETDRAHRAMIKVNCDDCGAAFEFLGVVPSAGLEISEDRQELTVAIAESPIDPKWLN
jgi:hypothetical protein